MATVLNATAAPTDVVVVPRRGRSKAPNFAFRGPLSVIRLELDVSDEQVRRRLEGQWKAVFRLRRALQRDGTARCRAFRAAHRERARDPKRLRERLGLTRTAIEAAAKAHIDESGWMRDHLTKAVGLHVAGEVWQSIDRHLFTDAAGRRHGMPRVGTWWEFSRIPGRARSHTKKSPVWETWRLVGTLDGHLNAYRHPQLPASAIAAGAAGQAAGTSILAQPAQLPAPPEPESGSWWDHSGALAVLFTGLPAGDLVMPVRLPQGSGQWAHLRHFLAHPSIWHKIDLVRVRDRRACGGWRYYAHLLVHQAGYQSSGTRIRRAKMSVGRRAGVDVNVSNLSVASFPDQKPDELMVEQFIWTAEQQRAATRSAKQARTRQRALDRSRRNSNPNQYGLSVRQAARAARRGARGLAERRVPNPSGARAARTDGVPLTAYRDDTLSRTYQRTRVDHVAAQRARSQGKKARARELATHIVARHGPNITVEACVISTWAKLWGKRIQLFSPGMLIAALTRECKAAGGRLQRVGTRDTALSQHCPCGQWVPKTLRERSHVCPACGLRGDRDVVSAALAACVELIDPGDPATARVNYELAHALRAGLASQQEGRAQSTGTSHLWDHTTARARAGSDHRVASAEQRNHHPAHPRTDRPQHRTSRDQPKKQAPEAQRWKHDPSRVNS
jgi:hypothetical protein